MIAMRFMVYSRDGRYMEQNPRYQRAGINRLYGSAAPQVSKH